LAALFSAFFVPLRCKWPFLAPQRNEERRETVNQIELRATAVGHSLHVRDMNLTANLTTRDGGRVLVVKHSIEMIIQDQT
jgi:hypothetical protein